MSIQTFDVTAERDGKWWVFEIPELGTGGQAISLDEIEFEAQGVAAMWLDIAPAAVKVIVRVRGEDEALAAWAQAEADEAAARAAQARAADERSRVVRNLRNEGYSARDVSRLLGVSRQRVYQVLDRPASVLVESEKTLP